MEIMKIYIIGEKLERSELLKQKKQLVCKAAWGFRGRCKPPPLNGVWGEAQRNLKPSVFISYVLL